MRNPIYYGEFMWFGRRYHGYNDYACGKISEEFWTRRSQEWEAELQTLDAERARLEQPRPCVTVTGLKILELAKEPNSFTKARTRPSSVVCSTPCYRTARSIAEVGNDALVQGNETGDWRGVWDEFRNWLVHAA
jgi:hypothetical protein